jgi:DNA-binding CsgD family transcriptional regulator
MCLGTGIYGIAYAQTLFDPFFICLLGLFFVGVGYIWIIISIYGLIARSFSLKVAIVIITLAQVIEQLFSLVLNYVLPEPALLAACLLLPLCALLAFQAAESRTRPIKLTVSIKGSAQRHFVLLLVAATIALVIVNAMSSVGIWGSAREAFTVGPSLLPSLIETVIACALLLLASYLTLFKNVEEPLSLRYQIPFLLLIAALLLPIGYEFIDPVGQNAILQVTLFAAELFAHILMWTIAMAGMQTLSLPAYKMGGIGAIVYSGVTILWVVFFEGAFFNPALVLAACYILILLVAVHPRILSRRERARATRIEELNEYTLTGEPPIPLETSGAAVAQTLHKRCELLGETYGLSPRETEALFFLAQGKSKPAITEAMVLSDGTVKTHIMHVFTKMQVHSRQEIVDLVFGNELPKSR